MTIEPIFDLPGPDSVPLFSLENKSFVARCGTPYDGDTLSVTFSLNGVSTTFRARMLGYDSPEMKPPLSAPNREEIKARAVLAKNRLEELIFEHASKSVRILCHSWDKYGRLLITMHNFVREKSINDIMVEEGHGNPYFGGTKT